MATDLKTIGPNEDNLPSHFYRGMEGLTRDELRRELALALAMSAEGLSRAAAAVRRLEEIGDDVSDLRHGMLEYLRLIAHGQVLPELVASYAGRPLLLSKATTLPIPDQRRIAAGEPIRVLSLVDGGVDHRLVSPADLTSSDIRQVFGPGHIRNDAQQRGFLEAKPAAARRVTVVDEGEVKLDKRRGGIVVGGVFLSRSDLADYVARLERVR